MEGGTPFTYKNNSPGLNLCEEVKLLYEQWCVTRADLIRATSSTVDEQTSYLIPVQNKGRNH